MRTLLVSRTFPSRPDVDTHGVFGRLRTLVKGVAVAGSELTFLFYVDEIEPYQGANRAEWEDRMCDYFGMPLSLRFATTRPYDPRVRGIAGMLAGASSLFSQAGYARVSGNAQVADLDAILDIGFDLVFVHRMASMPPLMRSHHILPPIILDMDDVEHVAFFRSIFQPPVWLSKYFQLLQIPALMAAERQAVRMAKQTLVCSSGDVRKLEVLAGRGRVTVVPNSVNMPTLTTPAEAPVLLFLGTFNYAPNVAAVEYMLNEVWPLILRQLPEARFIVGGQNPAQIRHFALPPPNVTFAGYLPSLDEAYASARAVVCPVLSGGGTRVKIIEATSYGRAVVSTSIGAEGLDFVTGSEIFIADEPRHFASACLHLLEDKSLAERVGTAARLRAEQLYDRKGVVQRIADLVRTIGVSV